MMIEVFSDVGPILANEFIFGGVFDRFPKLKVILGEYEISWVPWFLFRIQQIQGSLGQSLKIAPIEKPSRSIFIPRSGTASSTTSTPTGRSMSPARRR